MMQAMPHSLHRVVDEHGARLDGLCREISACREEAIALREESAALCECLVDVGVLSPAKLPAQLHRRRFVAAQALYHWSTDASLEHVLRTHEIALAVGVFAGPVEVRPACAVSRSIGRASCDVFDAVRQLCNSHIYVCGGGAAWQEERSAERFTPAAAAWERLPPMAERRRYAVAGAIAGRLYVCGGWRNAQPLNSAERFDPSAGLWETLPPMSERRRYAVAAAIGGKLYVCGGGEYAQPLSTAERYDPGEGSWESLPSMLEARTRAVAAVVSGQLYVCGGLGTAQVRLSSAERFLAAAATAVPEAAPEATVVAAPLAPAAEGEAWEALPAMSTRRESAAVATISGRLYLCGGWGAARPLSSAERLEPTTAMDLGWEVLPPMAERRESTTAASVGGMLYICGGCVDMQVLSSAERYDPVAGAWESLPPMSARRKGAFAAAVAGSLYVWGGLDASAGPLGSAERFDPVTGAWAQLPPMAERRGWTAVSAVVVG